MTSRSEENLPQTSFVVETLLANIMKKLVVKKFDWKAEVEKIGEDKKNVSVLNL